MEFLLVNIRVSVAAVRPADCCYSGTSASFNFSVVVSKYRKSQICCRFEDTFPDLRWKQLISIWSISSCGSSEFQHFVLWQGFLSAVDTHFNTEPLHDPHDQTSPSSLQIYYYSLGFPQTGRPCVHILVIVSSVLTSLKEAGGDFSWVNFSFYFIFCGFNGGNTTTFVYRGLQIQQNIKVPCWSFSRTADKNCIFYLVSYANISVSFLSQSWVNWTELLDMNWNWKKYAASVWHFTFTAIQCCTTL